MSALEFLCVVDEISISLDSMELFEVRGSPLIEKHFKEIEADLRYLGFEISTEMESPYWAIHKTASGRDMRDVPGFS
ncbi:MAG: hypothetical protein JNG88_08355 [Phycisphaerales bacterium]|nr:hypothetical protein [Phycisphaerales bacterium]